MSSGRSLKSQVSTTGMPVLRSRSRALRSEEHTSELQSQSNLVCRLLLEKKNNVNEIDDQLHLVEAFKVCHLRRVARFYIRLQTRLRNRGSLSSEHGPFATQVL